MDGGWVNAVVIDYGEIKKGNGDDTSVIEEENHLENKSIICLSRPET